MTSPLGPTPAEADRNLLDFLRRNPARHRAVAAVALALVAGATIGRACDPFRLHALVVASLITALLVLSDLFVQPAHPGADLVRGRRAAWLSSAAQSPPESDRPLPSCPACGLPVFAHGDDAPAYFSGLSWRRGSSAHIMLFPLVTAQMHANDDHAPDARSGPSTIACLSGIWSDSATCSATASLLGAEAAEAFTDQLIATAVDPSASAPELVDGNQHHSIAAAQASYAGSRLKTALDMFGAGVLLITLAPLMLAIACLLAVGGGRPILVHQDRLDWSGGYFRVSRFRSIAAFSLEACEFIGPLAAGPSTLSMTMKLEAFLHRSGLASLPLLLSVLRGDLSFVGPDPAMPKMSRRDRVGAAIVAEFAARTGARPGLTGWAEVNAAEARGRAITARQKIACDLYYLEHGSPLLDLRILARALDALASKDRA